MDDIYDTDLDQRNGLDGTRRDETLRRRVAGVPLALLGVVVVAILATLLFLGGDLDDGGVAHPGSPSPSPMPLPTLTPSPAPTVNPSPSSAPTSPPPPQPTQNVPPSAEPTLATAPPDERTPPPPSGHWQAIGQIDADPYVDSLLAFDGGYVAYSRMYYVGRSSVWQSVDGTTWLPAQFDSSEPCSDDDDSWPAAIEAGATDGVTIVLAGALSKLLDGTCRSHAATWLSTDGINWTRSDDIAEPGRSEVTAVWSVPDGWEATVDHREDDGDTVRTTVWRSGDGLHWEELNRELWPAAHPIDNGRPEAVAVSRDGTRILSTFRWVGAGESSLVWQPLLLKSRDGRTWEDISATIQAPDATDGYVTHILAPGNATDEWHFVVHDDEMRAANLWTSGNLAAWAFEALPRTTISAAIVMPEGILISGCNRRWEGRCGQYLLRLNESWSQLEPVIEGPVTMVSGPAGVLLLEMWSGRVWKLQP